MTHHITAYPTEILSNLQSYYTGTFNIGILNNIVTL